ncbi:MAG: hypothetical protein R3B89_31170 [Polyangiaceae bacterium]
MITAADSMQTGSIPCSSLSEEGKSEGATVASALNTNAEPVPRAISVNMLRCRDDTLCQPRLKNGAPAQSTTGAASTS